MKKKHTTGYTAEELRAMRARGEDRTDWDKVDNGSADDAEDIGLDWTQAKLVVPENKEHINLRIDADILRFFKENGKGYQTRMNAVLRSYMLSQQQHPPY